MKLAIRSGTFDPATASERPSVSISTLIPQQLAELVQEEANRLMVSRSQIVRWALVERYMQPDADPSHG